MKKNLTSLFLVLLLGLGYTFAQAPSITGRVTDQANEGLPGVNVLVNGTNRGTTTDANGNFTVSAAADATLTFSYIGFQSQSVKIGTRSVVDVQMAPESKNLSEVVVTALGIKREAKTLGYATATVDADQISTNRTPNFVSGLQGKMAGVNITTMGTGPAGTAKIRIRGQSSFSGNNSPLIVVNGVPIDNSNYALGGDFGTRAANRSDGGDGLSSINPDDIETMTVLKGATGTVLKYKF